MPFTPKDWRDSPGDLTTPITAVALEDIETRLAAYADLQARQIASFGREGTLSVVTGPARFRVPAAATIVGVSASVGTAPTGASLIVDVHKNGTTIYTTQGNRPTIAAAALAAAETVPDVTSLASGDYLTVDIDQVGSTIAGADLGVFVRFMWT